MNFAELLISIREQKGLTQAELAARLGLSHASVGRMEKGKIRPSVKTGVKIKALAEELGIQIGNANAVNNTHNHALNKDSLSRVLDLWERDKDEATGREIWMRDREGRLFDLVSEQQKINGTQADAIHKFAVVIEQIPLFDGKKVANRRRRSALNPKPKNSHRW